MKISTKGRYALRIMIDLAENANGEYIRLKDISARQGITLKYMEQIMPMLTKAGYVRSEMIFANTSQAKGLIERYNGTAQRRLPNDIIRFKIKDYDQLNIWFNDFYIKYLNEKFAHLPIDPVYEFVELTENYDLNLVFTVSNTRKIVEGNMFSYNGYYYVPYDKNGEVVKIRTSTEVTILYFVLENKIRMKYIGIIYDCTLIGTKHKNKQVLINDHKDLNNLIQEMDKKTKGSH